MLDLLREWGEWFRGEPYIVSTRVVSSLWTLADIVIVFYLIRIGNLFRRHAGERPHRISYGILAATLPFAAMLPFVRTGMAFVRIEFIVTLPHFALILYLLVANANLVARSFARYTAEKSFAETTPDTS